MKITAAMVKELREVTNAGVLDCKNALTETGGDVQASVALLREKGLDEAAKRTGRQTQQGVVVVYSHPGDKLAAMVELNCETDFVARTDEFRQFARELAMQVAAMSPQYVSVDHVPPEIEAERSAEYGSEIGGDKPAHIVERIVQGKLAKLHKEVCLLEQPFIKDSDVTIGELIQQKIALLGENIVLRRFCRFEIGQ